MPAGAQSRGAETAEAVGEDDRADVVAGVEFIDRLLERDAHLIRLVVQADFQEAHPDDAGVIRF